MEVTNTLVLDLREVCEQLEASIGKYLPDNQQGYYLPYQLKPTLIWGVNYYKHLEDEDVLIKSVEDIDGDVFNERGDIVVKREQAKLLSLKPRISPRMVVMVTEYVEAVINEHARWQHPKRKSRLFGRDFSAVLLRHVMPIYADDTSVAEAIEDWLLPMRDALTAFLDDEWVMFFVRRKPAALLIERTIDFRIAAWMREHGDELGD